jgi:heme/copper-type cytochrome/quinol oxidase subunit 3
VRVLRGKITEHNTVTVRLCTMFWHFVDVVWILMFLSIYLL